MIFYALVDQRAHDLLLNIIRSRPIFLYSLRCWTFIFLLVNSQIVWIIWFMNPKYYC